MLFVTVLQDYLLWHYTRAFRDIFNIWRNLTYFVFHFFSIPLLLRTFFAPWKRIEAERETVGLDLKDYFSTKLVNLIMRVVGATMRTILIMIGLACTGAVVVAGLIFFVIWPLVPLLIVVFIVAGITLIVRP